MNHEELKNSLAEKLDVPKTQAELILKSLNEVLVKALKKEKVVKIKGLGTFKLKETAERKGFNPRTKEPITIKASKKVSFSSSKDLKEAVL